MPRQLLNVFSRLSLVVCVASVTVLALHLGPMEDMFKSKWVRVDGTMLWVGPIQAAGPGVRVTPGPLVASLRSTTPTPGQWPTVGVELWLIALLAAVLPVTEVLLPRPRATINLCLTCGYDLRGTPQRCPECGSVILPAQPLPPDPPPSLRSQPRDKRQLLRELASRQKDHHHG